MLSGKDSGTQSFTMGILVFAIAIMFLLPTFFSVFVEKNTEDVADENISELLDGYVSFTGQTGQDETIWCLTGITTPYYGGAYHYSKDGWLYGSKIGEDTLVYDSDLQTGGYTPTQYDGTQSEYTVYYDAAGGVYRYVGSTQDGHKANDLYTAVTMDAAQKSNIFFTAAGKHTYGSNYYYDYTGYRYSFQPLADWYYTDEDGNVQKSTATTSSLSLIWYQYYSMGGIAGQLVVSGSDQGVTYITSQEIIKAFNATTSTAKFQMKFGSKDMNLYIRINPYWISQGMSVEDCYNNGYYEVMVSSVCTNLQNYLSTSYSFNINDVWDTMIDLFTFNTEEYGITGEMGIVASVTISVCFYAALIALASVYWPLIIVAGIAALIQGLSVADIQIPDLWPFW